MKRLRLTAIIPLLLFVLPFIAYGEESPVDYDPKLLAKIDLTQYFSNVNGMTINEDHMWVWGSPPTVDKEAKYMIGVFDIKDIRKPKLVWSQTRKTRLILPIFYKDYAYSTEWQREKNSILHIYKIRKPFDVEEIGSLEIVPHEYVRLLIVNDDMFIVGSDRGAIYESRIYRFNLEDPLNPKLISDKYTDSVTKKEKEYFSGFCSGLFEKENFIYSQSGGNVTIFHYDDRNIYLTTEYDTYCRNIHSLSPIGSSLSTGQFYLYMIGSMYGFEDIKDIEMPDSKENLYDISSLLAIISHSGASNDPMRGSAMSNSFKMPFTALQVESGRTLAYVLGHDFAPMISAVDRDKYENANSVVWVIDFQKMHSPAIVGKYKTKSPFRYAQRLDNRVFMLKGNSELEVLEVPVIDAEFFRQWSEPSESTYYRDPIHPKDLPEKGIESILRREINKPEGELTSDYLKGIKTLEIKEPNITNIEGIEQCVNLEEFKASHNNIKDITPLANLTKMKHLSIENNLLESVEPLRNLTDLEVLKIGANKKIKDFSPIKNLTKLRELDINATGNEDLKIIANFQNLEDLKLHGTYVNDLTPLEKLSKLKTLDIWTMDVQDFTPISKLQNLETLNVSNVIIRDFSGVSKLNNLKELELNSNGIDDISFLENLTKLEKLELSSNRITDISPITNLTNLKSLKLQYNQIADISPLVDLHSLERLELRNNQITDISPLGNLKNLSGYLYLDRNKITDISPLIELEKVEWIDLSGNQIKDLSLLGNAKLGNLVYLNLTGNQIDDISPLVSLENLTNLILGKNNISDITPLTRMKKLNSVNITTNKVTYITPLLKSEKRPDNCIIYLNENPLDQKYLFDKRKELGKLGWLIGATGTEYQSMMNMIAIADISQIIKDKSLTGNYGTFDDIKREGYIGSDYNLEKTYPGYEFALFEVTPSEKLPDGTIKESTLKIVIKPKTTDSNFRIFAITEDLIPREWIGDVAPADFSDVDLDDENLWRKWTRNLIDGGMASCIGGG